MGAGAGHMQDMLNRLKANKALRSKGTSLFGSKDTFLKSDVSKKLKFKDATPEELAQFKAQLEKENALRKKRKLVILGVTLVLLVAVCVVLRWFFLKYYFN